MSRVFGSLAQPLLDLEDELVIGLQREVALLDMRTRALRSASALAIRAVFTPAWSRAL